MFVLDWGWIAGDAIKRHPLLRWTKRCTYRAHMLATRPLPCCFLSLSFFILTYFICLFPLPFWYCWYFNFAPHSPFSIPFVLAIHFPVDVIHKTTTQTRPSNLNYHSYCHKLKAWRIHARPPALKTHRVSVGSVVSLNSGGREGGGLTPRRRLSCFPGR